MKGRVLLIGDSMAMPRNEVTFEQTWIYKLIIHFPDVLFVDKSRRGSTTLRLVQEGGGYKGVQSGADLLEYYKPDLVIIQLGIVDCSPRLVSKHALSTKLINKCPAFVKTFFYRYKKKFCVRKPENADISPGQFQNYYETYIKRAKEINSKVLGFEIAPVGSAFVEKSPFILESIEKYNAILSNLEKYDNFKVISTFSQTNCQELLVDELHSNEKGHDIFFNKLKNELCQI